jgi:diguanylate cyclase (GGDEF)-like protein
MRARPALGVAGGGAVLFALVLSGLWAPDSKWVGLGQDVVSAAATVGLWVGVRRHRGASRRAWTLIAIGVTAWVVGDFVWNAYAFVGAELPDVSIADILYLAAYPLLATGVVMMARSRAGNYLREGLLDGCIFTVSATIVVWQFLVLPISGTSSSWFTTTVWSAYPLADALLLGAVVWLTFTPGRRSAPTALLMASLGTMLVVDVLVSLLPAVSSFNTSYLYPLYPVAYVLVAGAALHPGSSELTTAGPASTRIHPVRFALVGCGLCAAAIVAVGPENTATTRYVFLGFALALCVMVVMRFAAAIRAREIVQDQLMYRSTHDELTGVVNRVLLLDRISHALVRAQRPHTTVAVLYVDLDHFKSINDTYGHDIGDELLVDVVRRLRLALRPSDTIGRMGGDEFVVLCEDLDVPEVIQVAQRITSAIAEPTSLSTLALQVTASVGIAINADDSCTVDTLIRDADTTMYEVKRRGGNGFALYDTRIRDAFTHRRELEDALRDATATGELVLQYHPIVRPRDSTVASFEALLRWQRGRRHAARARRLHRHRRGDGRDRPDRRVGPRDGLSQARDLGARRHQRSFDLRQRLGPAVPPRRTAARPSSARSRPRGADPTRLTLEITESVLIADNDNVIGQLEAIRQLGVRIAIDDFGTGYSGFSYLHRLPVDIIKIDQSLTADIGTDPAASIVVSALINLAHALGFQVIAEGAETADQVERLDALECDQIQGFYYARPAPAEEADFIARNGLRARELRGGNRPSR